MSKARVVSVTSGAAVAIRRGHPWVWRDAVARGADGPTTGQVVEIHGHGGDPLGQGIWDETSPIAARVYARAPSPPLDAARIVQGIERSIARRQDLARTGTTTAYRLCNGEGDRVPAIVIDRYETVAVMRLDGTAIATWLGDLGGLVWELLQPLGIRSFAHRIAHRDSQVRLEPLFGEPPPEAITVRENGVAMLVDLAHGQKTGAFLDQRDNRARVRDLAAGRRVLNLFSYAGGFSTAAALGGARRVTSVDVAHGAHKTAELSMRANGIDPSAHAFVTADVFAFLAGAKAKAQSWDLVVSDPPSFAPSEKAKPNALAAYRKLHAACAAVLEPGGILCASSCSSHVSAEEFVATLDDATLGRADVSLAGIFGSPADHPSTPAWPEGRYLKFVVLR